MTLHTASFSSRIRSVALLASVWLATLPLASAALADPGTVNVTVKSSAATSGSIDVGFRWLLEEDSTWAVDPDAPDAATTTDTLALNFHKSHMNVVAQGHSDSNPAAIPVPDTSKRYFLSILPDQHEPGADPLGGASRDCSTTGNCYTQSGRQVTPELFGGGATATLTVTLPGQPVPTAQIFARAFQDSAPINGMWDLGEASLGGWTAFIYDMGGQMMADTFGNPFGTVYAGDGSVVRLGDGTLHTMTAEEVADAARNPYGLAVGELLIKGLAPGKYGVQIVPPQGEAGWQQTTTIEGTRGIDAWVKANEPRYFAEFGPAGHHVDIGFVNSNPALNDFPEPGQAGYPFTGSNTITGQVRNLRMARPPTIAFSTGHPLPGCRVGLNDEIGTRGFAVVACDEDSNFSFSGLADGTYQVVIFDQYLDNIIATQNVTLPGGGDMGNVGVFRWFGSHDHYVFNDLNENGIWEPGLGEKGIPDQAINLRYRDGSIYNSSTTDTEGYLPFDELFPFFSWLVAEVDFARFKATGAQVTVDAGGAVDNGAFGRGKLAPQPQNPPECTPGSGCQSRLELPNTDPLNFVGPPLLEGYNSFLGSTQVFEWGKRAWGPGENGGISGVIYYQTTRAENDPRFAAPETWEPGIPRVQVALYRADATGRIYHKNLDGSRGLLSGPGSPAILADVDNHPLDNFPGVEDIDRDDNILFDLGDALKTVHADSWDDSTPENCPGNPTDPFYQGGKCYDGLRNFNQVRPAVFDGGYAFGRPFEPDALSAGYYVVQASPPRGADGNDVYQIQQEEDKNVDFGDVMTVSPQALPPYCVGGIATDGSPTGLPAHDAGTVLTSFSTPEGPIEINPANQGMRPGCDFRLVQLTDGKNAAVDFFMFTDVQITGHIQGFVLNDVANEFDPNTPTFSEKLAPSWTPVSVRDYEGNELYHTYTDKWGTYNAIVPSSFRINTPMPSGVSPNMLQVCLNAPTTQDADGNWIPEPRHNRQYSQFCYTLDFKPGQTTYLDTPVLPVAAFVGPSNWQLDCEYPSGTPVINFATVGADGPYISAAGSRELVIYSMGNVDVLDPLADRTDATISGGNNSVMVSRDFGFGSGGEVWIGNTLIPAGNVTQWTNGQITLTVPADALSGQLRIRRADTGKETVHGLAVSIDQPGQPATVVHSVHAGGSIQAAIDAANAGDLVMVEPGTYLDMLVVTKPIRLQGWGAASTIINPVQSPTEKLALWRDKLNSLANCTQQIGLLPGQPNNAQNAAGPCGYSPGTGLFAGEEGAGILVAPRPGVFGGVLARIDGFTITGADQSGGIIVNGYATNLEISNNIVSNNQGQRASGISIGQPLVVSPVTLVAVDAQNDGVRVHHNHVAQNGGLFTPGAGIGLYTGADSYQVHRNYVCGNYSGRSGAGIAHYGLSNTGNIFENKILFNQAFDQTVGDNGHGGGILVAGYAPPAGGNEVGAGTGLRIERNLIQGNNAGSGEGGGIRSQRLGAANSKVLSIINNILVNNVAGVAGGGISMDRATRVTITNNTIVNNDSSATAVLAFVNSGACIAVNPSRSCPQAAGVVSHDGNIGAGGFRNNIVLGNRAFHVEVDADPGSPTVGAVSILYDGFADLGGTGLYTSGNTDGIRNSLLSDTNVILGAGVPDYCTTPATRQNTCRDPLAIEGGHFADVYFNQPPSFSTGGTYTPPEGATLANLQAAPLVAVAADEGGNFIDIHYGPLSQVICDTNKSACIGTPEPGSTEVLSNHHLQATASDAINATGNGNGAAPTSDIDLESRPKLASNLADRGADEYWAPGTAVMANFPPTLPVFGLQLALSGAPFRYQVPATDPNGDALRFRLLPVSPIPAGMTIDEATGVISWTPVWPPAGCLVTSAVTRTCGFIIQVTDATFAPAPACPAANCASSLLAIVVRQYAGAPTANPNTYAVNTMGTFAVVAPGVLANDNNPNGGFATLTAQLVADNTAAAGRLTLGRNGSVTFIPNANWVGSTNFTYGVTDGVDLNPLPAATVTFNRQIAATTARYINGTWTFEGLGSVNGRRIHIIRTRGGVDVTTTATRPTVTGGAWSFSRAGGPNFQFGETVTIRSENNAGSFNFQLLNVPVLAGAANDVMSTAHVQCPLDADHNGLISLAEEAAGRAMTPAIVCKHLAAGDGWVVMGDDQRTELYTFGFNDVSKVPENQALAKGILNAQFPAPTLDFDQGDEVFLTLTNAGTLLRPDLFDPHSVHFHGFPNAAAVFDGVPEASITINMGFSFTYYYKTLDPGTYMYHCHVEASEHMQMGMLGNLYVRPAQNRLAAGTLLGAAVHAAGNKYVYNDGDASTRYDVEFPIQIGSFDRNFHEQHIAVQPLPFAEMHDDYPMLNGRGYPDTMNVGNLPAAPSKSDPALGIVSGSETSQSMNTRIVITKGQKALLRISNLNVTRFYTLATTGLPMQVVGTGAHILRGPAGGAAANLYYTTNSVTLGGGEAVDVLIDTSDASVQTGRYLLYSTNLEALSNGAEDFGGMMTEIVITAP